MGTWLIFAGIFFIGLALWKGKVQSVEEQSKMEEIKKLRDELLEAKKDVGSLLEQLESVSEKVVEEITAKVEEVKSLQTSNDKIEPSVERELESETLSEWSEDSEPEDQESEGNNDILEADIPQQPRVTKDFSQGKTLSANVKAKGKGYTIMFPKREKTEPTNILDEINQEQDRLKDEMPAKHQMVYAMAKLGLSVGEIAKQMKIGKGEVSLMLQLKRKGEEANG